MSKKVSKTAKSNGLPTQTASIPAAKSIRVLPRAPVIRAEKGKSIVCAHEQISTVSGSVSFASTKLHLNPGLPYLTWLSGQASGWEKHRFRKAQIVYVPAEAVTTTPGSVYLAVDYDPMDNAPSTLAALSTYETQSNGRVYEKISLDINCNRAYDGIQAKKVRCGPIGSDLQLYDACTFSVSTISCSNTDPIGQLWIYYEVELISQQTEPSSRLNPGLTVYNLSSSQSFTSGARQPILFDEALSDGMALVPTSGIFTMPCGSYLIFGEVGCRDTATEEFTASVDLFINSTLTNPGQNSTMVSDAADTYLSVPFTFYASDTSSFTMSVRLVLTGAAGTLTAVADRCRIFIRAL